MTSLLLKNLQNIFLNSVTLIFLRQNIYQCVEQCPAFMAMSKSFFGKGYFDHEIKIPVIVSDDPITAITHI